MKSYKVLDITAILLVVGFLSYAGVIFLKPEAVVSVTVGASFQTSPPAAAAENPTDSVESPAAGFAQPVQTDDFEFLPPQDHESEFYISSSHAHLIDEAKQDLPALTAPGRDSSGSSAAARGIGAAGSSASSGGSSSSGFSGAASGGSGDSSSVADADSKPQTGNGAGAVATTETEKQLPEWIMQEGIRAGFFSASCDTDYNLKMKEIGLNTAIVTRMIYDLKHLPTILKDYLSHTHTCKQIGMHMFVCYTWQPGGQWEIPTYRPVVFSDGSSGLFPCPLDETFWQEYLINIAVRIAGISLEDSDSIIDGIFLDMEMYGTEALPNEKRYYTEDTCFCDSCFSDFIANRTPFRSLPPVRKDRRQTWLSQNGFLQDYYIYLGERMETKAELLKISVHAVNPQMLFGVYPRLSEANWVRTHVMRAIGRNSYPVISFTTDTYGYFLSPWGADRIPADLPFYFEQYDVNGVYAAGYMFCKYTSAEIGQHLIKSCQRAQGYWLWDIAHVFDEKLKENLKEGSQGDYLKAIRSANMMLGKR